MKAVARKWFAESVKDAKEFYLPFIAKMKDGTFRAMDADSVRSNYGKYQTVVSVAKVDSALTDGATVNI